MSPLDELLGDGAHAALERALAIRGLTAQAEATPVEVPDVKREPIAVVAITLRESYPDGVVASITLRADGTHADFTRCAIAPEWQRRGLLSDLVAAFRPWLDDHGFTTASVVTPRGQERDIAQRLGFQAEEPGEGRLRSALDGRVGEYARWRAGEAAEPEWHVGPRLLGE